MKETSVKAKKRTLIAQSSNTEMPFFHTPKISRYLDKNGFSSIKKASCGFVYFFD